MPESIERGDDQNRTKPGWEHAFQGIRAHSGWILRATVVFQLLVLGSMVAGKTAVLWSSNRTVLLRVLPVDPRDLFRGEYVILGYEIGRIPPEGIASLGGPLHHSELSRWEGRTVYVRLKPEPDGEHYGTDGVSAKAPSDGSPFIRGRLDAGRRVTFGIESYFVQEGKGKAYEAAVRERRLSAEVALAPDGQASLLGLRIEPAAP